MRTEINGTLSYDTWNQACDATHTAMSTIAVAEPCADITNTIIAKYHETCPIREIVPMTQQKAKTTYLYAQQQTSETHKPYDG
tara:strand:- start:147 stop:395 length:249 start_codon:yes stop_codon:yes gene_type:complete